jgi:hypothetical protein
VNPVTFSEKTTVKWMGEELVGSVCVLAWLIVTVGAVVSAAGRRAMSCATYSPPLLPDTRAPVPPAAALSSSCADDS